MNILIACGLSNSKLHSKLAPLIASTRVDKIYIVRKERIAGDKIVCFCPPGFFKLNIVFTEAYRIFMLVYLCLMLKIDLLIGIYLFPHGVYTVILGKAFRKKSILMPLGTDLFWNIADSRFEKIWLWLLGLADFIGVRGDNSKAYLIKRGLVPQGLAPQKIFIPPNVFDFDEFPAKKQAVKYQIITVGSLVADKRMDILLRAVAQVKQNIKHIKVAVIGSGKLESRLKNLAGQLGLTDNVDFPGAVSNVRDYLNASQVFVLTSRTEGLPMAMVEALSCGLPVVVAEVGDINTVAKNGINALLVSSFTPEAFARAIEKLLTDEQLYSRLAQNALTIRQDYKQEYSLENALKVWDGILDQV